VSTSDLPADFPPDFHELAHAVLDGHASEDDAARLSDAIAADPARAREFARLALLHDAIERSLHSSVEGRVAARRIRFRSFARRVALVAATLALAAGAAWFSLGTARTASADEVLARIATVARSGDRTYYLRAIGKESPSVDPKRSGRPAPTIDGAILYLRGSTNYVLARLDSEGGEVLTGSDGRSAWFIPAKGPVRVSRDTGRFSGALPGSKHDLAFVDPHGDLAALGASYDLKLAPDSTADALARIVAIRRSDARGGPKRIEIAYDPATAVIRAMRLENLPQARGGPRSVEFELIDDAPLADAFFRHDHHHGADRAVIEEDK
jgi:hypothetical protein